MTIYNNYIVFPEGDIQEIAHDLRINQLVDINGVPITLPLKTAKMIVYRVYKKTTKESKGEVSTFYYLEQLSLNELKNLAL